MYYFHCFRQDDIPHKSLKYLYGPFDPTESHGGFNTVSITDKTMVVTFFDSDGKLSQYCMQTLSLEHYYYNDNSIYKY